MHLDSQFRAADFAIARMPLLPDDWTAPRLRGTDAPEVLRAYLREVAADPLAREAILVSSPSLDAVLHKVVTDAPVEPKRLRRAAVAAARYLSRMTHRPTPFGLMAGVAPVGVEDDLKLRVGARHHRHVRADMGWLTGVLRMWEREPAVLACLRVVRNDLCFVRGDRLVLPFVRESDKAWGPDDREQTVRHTRAVRAVLAAARTPIGHGRLVGRLTEEFPEVDASVAARMVGGLIEREFLLTDLRPPTTAPDPVAYVLDRLRDAPETVTGPLKAVQDALREYAGTPLGTGRTAWRRATDAMRALHAGDQPLQVDLAMDADIVLPREVTDEAARAATVAWRVAPPSPDHLAEYRAEFLETYGPGAVVPVTELLDPQLGLGAPGGYLLPPSRRRKPETGTGPTGRDRLLSALAQRAAADGTREIILDDDLIEGLARPGAEDAPPTYAEIAFEVLADTEEDLRAGRFGLAGAVVNFTRPGAMFGRFLHMLPDLRAGVAAEGRAVSAGAVAAQLESMIMHPRNLNVVQVPELTTDSVRIGVFAERGRPEVHGLDDLAVTADLDRFRLIATRTGQEVVPLPFTALNQTLTVPNPIRFVLEVGAAATPPWLLWEWGQADVLPYLPRVRYERTVLCPARWRPGPELLDPAIDRAEWSQRYERWRAEWSLPDTVDVMAAEHRIRLDVAVPAGREMLRQELLKSPGVVIQEPPLGGALGTGWAHGHTVEVALPLRPPPPKRRPRPRLRPPAVQSQADAAARKAFPPGGEWLYVKVYAEHAREGELLTRHLPALLQRAAPVTDRWFYLRYRDDHPHLRLRFHGEPAALNTHLLPALHDWAAGLAGLGLIREITLDTYRPELLRYGGPAAIEAAERVFHADADSALEQLALRAQGGLDLPMELLVAANDLDLAARLHGDGWCDWLLAEYPKNHHHTALQRQRDTALRLLDPESGWAALSEVPGGERLLASWARRGEAVGAYGRLVRELVADGALESVSTPFTSVLHMHHNRLSGIAPESEAAALAIARGTVQVRVDRERHLERAAARSEARS